MPAGRMPPPATAGGVARGSLTRMANRSVTFIVVGFVAMYAAIAVILPRLPSAQLEVRLDMSASTGSSVSLYLNSLDVAPQTVPFVAGGPHTYAFAAPFGAITRMTPVFATETGAVVRIYSISVNEGGAVIAKFKPASLSAWARYSFGSVKLFPKYLQFISVAPSASMDEKRTVAPRNVLPFGLDWLQQQSTTAAGRLQLSMFAAALLGCLLVLRRKSRLFAVAVAVEVAVIVYTLHVLFDRAPPFAPVTEAIGQASYFGRSPVGEVHAVLASVLIATVLGVAAGVIQRRRVPAPETGPFGLLANDVYKAESRRRAWPTHSRSQVRLRRWRSALREINPAWWAVGATIVLGCAAYLPYVPGGIHIARTEQFVESWDGDNVLVWTALATHGLVPMRDFWYPYGNALYFEASLLWGSVAWFLCELLSFAGFSAIFWKLSGRRVSITAAALFVLVLLSPLITLYGRYSASMAIAVMFTALRFTPIGTGRNFLRALFALLFGAALFTELDVAAYGAIGVLCVILADGLWLSSGIRKWVRVLAFDLVGAAAAVGLWVTVTALRGQLSGELHFYLHPATITAYSASSAGASIPFGSFLSPDDVVLWGPVATFGIAIALRVWTRRAALFPVTVIALVGASVALLEKDLVRPISTELYLPLLLLVLCTLVSLVNWAMSGKGRLAPLIVGATCGVLCATAVASGEWSSLWAGFKETPRNIASNVATVVSPPASLASIEASRYNVGHFAQYADVIPLERVMAPLMKGGHHNLYVLGDAPTLYLMLDQEVPWEINLYNSSPIEDQRRVVAWIQSHRPRYVVLDTRHGESFDGVPYSVRVPLLYQEVIAHYGYVRSVGGFDILERTVPRSPSFWQSRLGGTIALGSVMESMPQSPPTVVSSKPSLLRVTVADPRGEPVTIPLDFGGMREDVSFTTEPGRHSYEVPLNRLWAWAMSSRVEVLTTPRGVRATILANSVRASDLY
jgi:hypothetical protein